MNFSPEILLGCLLYFGALLVPALFFFFNRGQSKAKNLMLIGVGLQVFWSMVVAAIAYFSWRAGNRDAFMAWGLMLPVNIVSFIYFLTVLFVYVKKDKK
jgi:ABC-type cobalamin transport system permease subunit